MTNQSNEKPDWEMSSQDRYDPERRISTRSFVDVVAELLREKGIARYEVFDGSSEGDVLPGDVDEVQDKILVQDGRVFRYWLGWDPEKTAPDGTKGWYDLGENSFWLDEKGVKHHYFEEVLPEDILYPKPDDPSFIAAKEKLGLVISF